MHGQPWFINVRFDPCDVASSEKWSGGNYPCSHQRKELVTLERPSNRMRIEVESDCWETSCTGSQADMMVEERVSQRVDLRAKVETDLSPRQTALGDLGLALYGGLDLGTTFADDVTAMVAGQPIDFGTDLSGFSMQGFVGAHAVFDMSNGASLALSGELNAGGESQNAVRLGAVYSMSF